MRLFLIDYENVNSAGLSGIGQTAKDDRIILFYSRSANTLSFEIMDEMLSSGIMPERVCLEQAGKNALDFQLVTFLGYLIAKDKADAYYIISRDTGYQAAIAFCQEYFGVKVHLKPSMKAALGNLKKQKAAEKITAIPETVPAAAAKPAVKKQKTGGEQQTKKGKPASVSLRKKATVIQVQPVQTAAAPEPESFNVETVMALLKPPVSPDTASEILRCLLCSKSKTEFHNALQQHFDNAVVKQYYRCMKPCFSTFAE
ncbi:MAG: hypothetical protein IKI58_05575 [Oscillospiraceae bacterium]|nr:hypothetical protein [Oscillospiraceae bacterium]